LIKGAVLMDRILENKVAVITGGTRGLGLAIAKAYGQAGASVVIASRSQLSVERALGILRGQGVQASGITCDVGEREQVKALAEHASSTFGHFDIWVNNAGMTPPYGPTIHINPEDFVRVIKTNILGVYFGSIYAMRHFLPDSGGKLINILGRGDRKPVAMQNGYTASKAWVRSFTLALAEEYKDSGVGVFAYNPGLMETDLMEKIEAVEGYEQRLKPLEMVMRMWANPPDVPAQKAVWLASSKTDGRTGLVINELNMRKLISGLLQEGFRRVTGSQSPESRFEIESVPPEIPLELGPEGSPA
jgi:glucose 1-dehydrogenase